MEKKPYYTVYLNTREDWVYDEDTDEIKQFETEDEANSYIKSNKLKKAIVYRQDY